MKAVNFLLVNFSDTPVNSPYLRGLAIARQEIAAWLLRYGLIVPSWNIFDARLAVLGKTYNEKQFLLTQDLISKGIVRLDGQTAWYIFPSTCNMGGTFGGDVFGQKGGQVANRIPGVSYFGQVGLYALAYDKGIWNSDAPRRKAEGCIAHELCHNVGLLPDQKGTLHAPNCVMTSGLYGFPNCMLETNGGIWGERKGDEIAALANYGFMRRV